MKTETVEFSSSVPKEEYDFFKENFPQYGAVKWFINTALKEFNDRVRENPSLREQVNGAVQSMLDFDQALRQFSKSREGEASSSDP